MYAYRVWLSEAATRLAVLFAVYRLSMLEVRVRTSWLHVAGSAHIGDQGIQPAFPVFSFRGELDADVFPTLAGDGYGETLIPPEPFDHPLPIRGMEYALDCQHRFESVAIRPA